MLNDALLPCCNGVVIEGGGTRTCPVHFTEGTITSWTPPAGLPPTLREYQCSTGHAFYVDNHVQGTKKYREWVKQKAAPAE